MKNIFVLFLLGLSVMLFFGGCEKAELETLAGEEPSSGCDSVFAEGEDDDEAQLLSVPEFMEASQLDGPVWVGGYIVGACARSISRAEWEPPFSYDAAILLADTPGETDPEKVIAIQLHNKELKEIFSLRRVPENYGRIACFYGMRRTYLGIWGMKEDIIDYGWFD